MMASRTLMCLTVAVVTAISLPAFAQSGEASPNANMTFRGGVSPGCTLASPYASVTDNTQMVSVSPGSADITISQLTDDNGQPLGAVVVLELPATCNQAHTLNLASLHGGLRGDMPEINSGPFRSSLPYTVTVSWAGGQHTFQSDTLDLALSMTNAVVGSIVVIVEIPSGGDPLVAGAYADELTLVLGVAG